MAKFDQGPQKKKAKQKTQCFIEEKYLNTEMFNTMKNCKIQNKF